MTEINIKLNDIKNQVRTNNRINSATHDLALYLMLKHKLFRSKDNVVLKFTDNTLKYVNLRDLINEEIAPVQANTNLVNKVTSYLTVVGNDTHLKRYFRVANGKDSIDSIAGVSYNLINEIITAEVQRLQDLEARVTVE